MSSLTNLALLLGALALAACGSESAPETKALDGVGSQNGAFVATFSPDPDPPVTGENALGILLSDSHHTAVIGAHLSVEPWMPAHGHGSSAEPIVAELGGGAYRAEQIQLMMPGHWELRLEVEAAGTSDSFVVGYEVK